MTVRVRFAPSPTGYLHIGGARTALYSYLYAKARGGSFILRVEDTDLERSKREYEESQLADLAWLGITPDEGPAHGGDYGPYRQSERLDLYKSHAQKLIDEGKAYHCFCSDEELERKKEQARAQKRPPHYDGTCRNLTEEEVSSKLAAGQKAVVRFKTPLKAYVFKDHVRSRVVFPEGMVGDFVIMRSNGMPVYNFCCVIDDMLMEMTHVIRAEEHLPNTLRQLMLYEAFEKKAPEFAHVSLLVGKDRQKLSKRHGATSVTQFKEENYIPEAMTNYLCLLGWSHPNELEVFELDELKSVFDLTRFSKAPALFDPEKLGFINGQHLRALSNEKLLAEFKKVIPSDSLFHQQDDSWMEKFCDLFKDQVLFFKDINDQLPFVFGVEKSDSDEMKDICSWETTSKMKDYLLSEVSGLEEAVSVETFTSWTSHLKKELGIKGKPLFKGLRACLTLKEQGPELKDLIGLIPPKILKERLSLI